MSNDPSVERVTHEHYVCPECGHETCPADKPTLGAFLAAADTHAGEEHPEMWGPDPQLEGRDGCDAA